MTDKPYLWKRLRSQFCNCMSVDNPWHSSQACFIQWLPNAKYINKPGNRGQNLDLLLLSRTLLQDQIRIQFLILFMFFFHVVNINLWKMSFICTNLLKFREEMSSLLPSFDWWFELLVSVQKSVTFLVPYWIDDTYILSSFVTGSDLLCHCN